MSTTQQANDMTGRKNMVTNVLAGWGGEGIFIVAGFIMPRMIDRRLACAPKVAIEESTALFLQWFKRRQL